MKKICLILMIVALSVTTFSKKIVFSASEKIPYIGESIENNGYVGEIVREALKRKGYEVEIDFYPEARSLSLAEQGLVDGILPIYKSEKLSQKLEFSKPMPGNTIGILKRKDYDFKFKNNYSENPKAFLNELKDKTVGAVRGRTYEEEFDRASYIKRDLATEDLQNIRKLEKKRVDFVIIDKYSAADLMVTQDPYLIGKLEFIASLSEQFFHIGFSKNKADYAKLTKEFNEGLAELINDGTLDQILEKHGFENNLVKKSNKNGKKKIRIGTVNNGDMFIMQKLSKEYEKQNPEIEIEWKVLDENTLRTRLLSSLAISDGTFDVMTIGAYEAPIWAQSGWLTALDNLPSNYDEKDILDSVKNVLSYKNTLYALPFYAESSMTYYRKDVFEKAGVKMPTNPTYEDIERLASKLHDPKNEFYGIGLRGKAGWGENMAFLTTLINSYGGRWFDKDWNPKIDTSEWKEALKFYHDLLINYGPPKVTKNGFNENKSLMASGKSAMWIDATVAAGMLFDPNESEVYDKIGFAAAPYFSEKEGSNWLWVWSLAIPTSSKNSQEAQKFITWATSKEYINLVGEKIGWVSVPPGTRESTYRNKKYLEVAPFAKFVLEAIKTANPQLTKAPYKGIQYVGIPEFPAIGKQVGEEVAKYLEGELSLDGMLEKSQSVTKDQMMRSGYIK